MASIGWYDSNGDWHEPDDPAPGRESAPANPGGGGYTIPTPTPTPAPLPGEQVVPTPTPTPTPPPPGQPPTYGGPSRPDTSWLSAAPSFVAPTWTPPPDFSYAKFQAPDPFKAPDFNAVLNDPGYIGRRDEGANAVRMGAASMGKLRTGGTIKDLLNYNQNFASREYNNVFDRNLGTYKTNYDNLWNQYTGGYNTAADQYRTNYGVSRDLFDRTYQGAKDVYAPQLLSWQTGQQAQQRAAEEEFNRQWQAYTYGQPSATDVLNAGAA